MNTHRQEKLRLAEAPDGTKVWIKKGIDVWYQSIEISWTSTTKYVVDDGRHVEIRKSFAEGNKIESYNQQHNIWMKCDNPSWGKHIKYRVIEPNPELLHEKHWRMLRYHKTCTESTSNYYSQEQIALNYKSSNGWHKGEYIEVEVK